MFRNTDTVPTMADDINDADAPQAPSQPQRSISPLAVFSVVALGALVTMNIVLLQRVSNLETQLNAGFVVAGQDASRIEGSVNQLAGSVGEVSDRVGGFQQQLNSLALAGSSAASEAPPAVDVGSGLPRFDPAVPDPAVGLQIAGLEGPEYYTGQTLSIDAADGKARAWLVWAHWCPYCQQEMPELKAWFEQFSIDFPDMEIVTLTTAIDSERGNPLVPYLDELQLPFPVIVDQDGSLSSQLGLNAFPFWVFTGPDGTVLGRSAGLLGPERFDAIAQQLQEIASSA